MRWILIFGALVLYTTADAAPLRHSRRIHRLPSAERAITAPGFTGGPGFTREPRFNRGYAVPGWTDEETQKWLNDATRMVGRGA
jgi:hypothetical protein